MRHLFVVLAASTLLPAAAIAQDAPTSATGKEALTLLTRGIAFKTVQGEGQVPAYAAYLKQQLVSAGFADGDVTFVPLGETGYLTARYPGRNRSGKPTIVLGHMDVVQADPKDWTRDPFTPVVEGGYVFGRGSLDNKAGVSMAVAALMKLKRARWVPQRDVVLVLTGDEETTMTTTRAAAAGVGDPRRRRNCHPGGGPPGVDGQPGV